MGTKHGDRGVPVWVDLTAEIGPETLSYPGTAPGMVLDRIDSGIPSVSLTHFRHLDAHCGTHLDAPLHFVPDACDIAGLPLQAPEIVFISSQEDLVSLHAMADVGDVSGKAVLFSTGWERHAGTSAFFHEFPALSPELAEYLAASRAALVGVDTLSVDPAEGPFTAHRKLLAAGIPIVEGLVGLRTLSRLLEQGWTACLVAFPLRIRGLDGSPVRAAALIGCPSRASRLHVDTMGSLSHGAPGVCTIEALKEEA